MMLLSDFSFPSQAACPACQKCADQAENIFIMYDYATNGLTPCRFGKKNTREDKNYITHCSIGVDFPYFTTFIQRPSLPVASSPTSICIP
jgi:hypothetical protein